jgi:hypothetical protein
MAGGDEFDLTRGGEQDERKAPVLSLRRRGRLTPPPGTHPANGAHRHLAARVQVPLTAPGEPAAETRTPTLGWNEPPDAPGPAPQRAPQADPVEPPVRSPRQRVSLAKTRPVAVLSGLAIAALIAGGLVVGLALLNAPSAHRTGPLSAALSRPLSQHSQQPILTAGRADSAIQHPSNATHRSTPAVRRVRNRSLRHTQPRHARRSAHASRPAKTVYVATSPAATQPTQQATQPTYTTATRSTTTSGAEATSAPTSSTTSSAATQASHYNGKVSAAGPTESGPPAPGGPPAP